MYTFLPPLIIVQVIAYVVSNPQDYSLLIVAALAIGVQCLAFIPASGVLGNAPTEKYYDATGAVTYISLIVVCIYTRGGWGELSTRQKLLSLCVLIWCTRLGYFLYSRIQRHGGIDFRFNAVKTNFHKFATYWGIQGVWCFVTALPAYICVNNKGDVDAPLSPIDIVGLCLWGIGFLIEAVADYQKHVWSVDNKAKASKDGNASGDGDSAPTFINTGFWRLSRHPNYFGEIILWVGVAICASGSFVTSYQCLFGGVMPPLFVACLLIFVSGIPLLEKAADKKFAGDVSYAAYKADVPVLIPIIGRKGNAKF